MSLIQACTETAYYNVTVAARAADAVKRLNQFSEKDLSIEQKHNIASSDAVFASVFTILNNFLCTPNITFAGLASLETIIAAEKDRCENQWQTVRKGLKRVYMRSLGEYDENKASVGHDKTLLWKYCSLASPPVEPDWIEARKYFDMYSSGAELALLELLRNKLMMLVEVVLQGLRRFTTKQTDATAAKVVTSNDLRALAIRERKGGVVSSYESVELRRKLMVERRFSSLNKDNIIQQAKASSEDVAIDDDEYEEKDSKKSIQMKMCLFLESLHAAAELGVLE